MPRQATGRVTLTDVATQAGVSPSTVSYILRRVEPHFSRYAKATIARVQRAAEDAGYAPNLLATALRHQKLPFFGVFFEMIRRGDSGFTGGLPTIMWDLYEGIARTARQDHRYPVVLTSPAEHEGLTESPAELDLIVRSGLCGVIAAVHSETWRDHVARWERAGISCVSLFDRGGEDEERWCVDLDNRAVGQMALDHLQEHGHSKIICVHQPDSGTAVSDRVEAFAGAQIEAGLKPVVMELANNEALRTDFVSRLRKLGANAVLAADGGASILAYQSLSDAWLNIPDE